MKGTPLHLAGCMLYWAEGTKNRNRAQLVNSDVEMVRFFCSFLRRCFGVQPEDFRVSLNFYTGNGVSLGIIQHIYGAIQEYVGSDKPRWLD